MPGPCSNFFGAYCTLSEVLAFWNLVEASWRVLEHPTLAQGNPAPGNVDAKEQS